MKKGAIGLLSCFESSFVFMNICNLAFKWLLIAFALFYFNASGSLKHALEDACSSLEDACIAEWSKSRAG